MLLPTPPSDLNPRVRSFIEDTRDLREDALRVLRETRTTAKGTGQPSIIDVGAIYGTLRKSLDLKQIAAVPDDEDAARLRTTLAARQSRASEAVWSEIRGLVDAVQRSMPTTEDLPTILRNVDKLVDEGHHRGKLPRRDTRVEYQELRAAVGPDDMTKLRAYAATLQNGPTAASLWDAMAEPRAPMTALARFAEFVTALLASMEAKLTASMKTTTSEGDPGALIQEFRGLADEFGSLIEALG